MAYATATELRERMDKTGTTSSGSEANLTHILEGVSSAIDRFFNRPDNWFAAPAAAAVRYFAGNGKAYLLIDECISISNVSVKDSPEDTGYTSWASTDWQAFAGNPKYPNFNDLPYNGVMVSAGSSYSTFTSGAYTTRKGFRPYGEYTRSVPTVKITARWGYAATAPDVIREATLALAARWFKQGQGAWTDTLASADFGGMVYRAENADIKAMLEMTRYHRPALGGGR